MTRTVAAALTAALVVLAGAPAAALTRTCDANEPCRGTQEDDTLIGTAGPDRIFGFAGYDVVIGNGGADDLFGGAGSDELYGRRGRDTLVGGGESRHDRQDFLVGGGGDDTLRGGGHQDSLFGGRGNDMLSGGPGGDFYTFGHAAGRDRIVDTPAYANTVVLRDVTVDSVIRLTSSASRPEVRLLSGDGVVNWAESVIRSAIGGRGDDRIHGNARRNRIVLFAGGVDTVHAGGGDDLVDARDTDGSGPDTVYCGDGNDRVLDPDPDDILRGCETINR